MNGALVTIEDFDTVSSGSLKPIVWNKSVYDTQQICTGTALKVPAGVTLVKIFFQVKWELLDSMPTNLKEFRVAQVRKNGTDDTQLPESRIEAASGTYTTQNASTPAIQVEVGDLFELWVGQNSGAAVKIFPHQTWFAMEIVEPALPVPVLTSVTVGAGPR